MTSRDSARTGSDAPRRLAGAPLADQTSFLLARANARSLALGNAALVAFGLRLRSYSVLALAAGDERPSQRELASFLSLDPSQVVALVDDLEARGLVERVADPRDRRANVVRATPDGTRLAAEAATALAAVDVEVFDGLSADEVAALSGMLSRVAFGA